jgi:glycosyltransferase involved in cell wall biosynthesis
VFPRTIVEAFALGVPVIASRIGSLAELVTDDATGLLADPDSAPQLAAALCRLEANPELGVVLGARARDTFAAKYAPDTTTSRLLDIYTQAGAPAQQRHTLEPAA